MDSVVSGVALNDIITVKTKYGITLVTPVDKIIVAVG